MKPLAHVAFALLLAGLQAALLRFLGGGSVSLALVVACVVYLGLRGGNVDGAIGAAGVGYVLDLVAATPKGLMTFLAVLLFLVARAIGAAVDVRGRVGFGVLSGFGALFLSIGAMILLRWVTPAEAAPGLRLVPRMLVEAILTGLLAPLVLVGMQWIDKLFHKEEAGLLR